MSPQHKGVVPEKIAAELERLAALRDETYAAIERTVLAALKAGGSSREIARHVRMEGASVFAMGKRLGWPDEKEKARRAAAAEERRKWDWMKNPVEPD